MAAFGAARYGHMGEKQQSESPIRLEGYTTTERRMQEKIDRRGNFFPRRSIGKDSDLVPDGVDDLLVRVALKRAGQADDGVDALHKDNRQKPPPDFHPNKHVVRKIPCRYV